MFEYFIDDVLLSKLERKLIYDTKSIVGAGQAAGKRQSTHLRCSGSMVSPEFWLWKAAVHSCHWRCARSLCGPLEKAGRILSLCLGASFSSSWVSAAGRTHLPGPTGWIFLGGAEWGSEPTWALTFLPRRRAPCGPGWFNASDCSSPCLRTLALCQALARGLLLGIILWFLHLTNIRQMPTMF